MFDNLLFGRSISLFFFNQVGSPLFQLPEWLPLGEALCDVDPETREAAVQVLSQAEVDHIVADCLGAQLGIWKTPGPLCDTPFLGDLESNSLPMT